MPKEAALNGKNWLKREELSIVPTPTGSETWQTIPHATLANSVIEILDFRNLQVAKERYAVCQDGSTMYGVIELNRPVDGLNAVLGLRNSHKKAFSMKIIPGCHVPEYDNAVFFKENQSAAKHTKNFSLETFLALSIDRFQRGLQQLEQTIRNHKEKQLTPEEARLFIYRIFVEEETQLPRHLLRMIHDDYFNNKCETCANTQWALRAAFTNSLRILDPATQFRTALELSTLF